MDEVCEEAERLFNRQKFTTDLPVPAQYSDGFSSDSSDSSSDSSDSETDSSDSESYLRYQKSKKARKRSLPPFNNYKQPPLLPSPRAYEARNTPPNCFGCGGQDHRMGSCPELKKREEQGKIMRNQVTGQETLVESVDRIHQERRSPAQTSLLLMLKREAEANQSYFSKAIREEEILTDQEGYMEDSDSSSDNEWEEEYLHSEIHYDWPDRYMSEEDGYAEEEYLQTNEFDSDKESDTPAMTLSAQLNSQVYALDRTPTASRNARTKLSESPMEERLRRNSKIPL
ncbi:hypothetical protein GYMLUDRAFT_54854 [Collybiopsis luxurians FD-317 M1]|nr:hypothetical protein GYMLUDRAFT_54854 [Collybiopsis luxurians FD-317 M1]